MSQTTLYCYFNPTLPLIIFDKSILRQMVLIFFFCLYVVYAAYYHEVKIRVSSAYCSAVEYRKKCNILSNVVTLLVT